MKIGLHIEWQIAHFFLDSAFSGGKYLPKPIMNYFKCVFVLDLIETKVESK